MKYTKQTRADLRGSKLLPNCQKAKRSTNEFGFDDKRVFCFGLNDMQTDELLEQCKECKANVNFVD